MSSMLKILKLNLNYKSRSNLASIILKSCSTHKKLNHEFAFASTTKKRQTTIYVTTYVHVQE